MKIDYNYIWPDGAKRFVVGLAGGVQYLIALYPIPGYFSVISPRVKMVYSD